MMNIMRADVYRIVRGKGIYITLAILLAVIVAQVLLGANMNAGVGSFDTLEGIDSENLTLSDFVHSPTGAEAPFQVMKASSNLLYLVLPLLILIGCVDFSSGAAKNTMGSGVSRSKYYCSKLILTGVCSALLMLIYVLLSFLLAVAVNGFDGIFNGEFIWNVTKIFLPQLWLLLAGVCVGNFFVFAFRRSAAAIGIYIAFLLVPPIIILALSFASDWFTRLFDYELTSGINSLTNINTMSSGDIIKFLAIGAGYAAVSIIAGLAIFKKAEIK